MQVGNGDNGSSHGSPLGGSVTAMLMARKRLSTTHTISEINVTPFVDVVLVLLIIFMITAPMLMRSMDVSLPSATLQRDSPSERTIVTVDAQGRTFVNNRAVNIELLEDEIKQRVEVENLRVAYLRADETLQYRHIIKIMDLLKRAGVDTVGLAYVYPEEKIN